jgi:hypothetical protein
MRAWLVYRKPQRNVAYSFLIKNNYLMQILIGCAKIMKGTAPEGLHLSELYTEPIFQQ